MRNLAVLLTLVLFSLHAFAQTPQPKSGNYKNPASKKLAGEKEEFDRAVALADAAERVAALRKFVKNFPKSKEKIRALELIASGRAALADEKFRAGEKEASIELFKLAVRETPKPVSDKLFAEVVLQIPNSLIVRGEAKAAIEIARLIEEKADGNAKQLLGAAAFYLAMENAADAKRLVEKAVALDANLPAAYQTLGLAHRLDFQLEESAGAYQKALELDADSTVSRRGLAEMKRATGKAAEAVTLYREILAKDANDAAAQTGLILALLDTENKIEAESEMQKSLAANPNNLLLLVGAAYWYAAHDDGARAIELAEKAINIEPRYTWARVALARGLMQQKRSMEAEKTLLAARQYGDFPTLDYELATARFQSGFYREAAEGLRVKFSVAADGAIKTRLGGRVAKEAKSFIELLAAERRASIFQTLAADNTDNADKLKSLLDFSQKLDASGDEAAIAAADEFVKGDDRMKMHRQLFAADQLLQKRKALPKVYELTKAAIGGVDAALDVPHPAAAVLADELYQSRRIAISRNELIIVPDVPRKTLSNILRGRIEDIAGWTLFQENKSTEAVTRLKRAVSVLPEKSSWWRASMWRLGSAHEAAGNQTDALDAYIKSYASGEADAIKYGIIETVYQKVNGKTDGLELKIGAKPASVASAFPVQIETKTTELPKSTIVQSAPEMKPETAPTPNAGEIAEPIAETKLLPEVSEAEKTVKVETAPTPKTEREIENREPQIEKTTAETKTEAKPNPINQNPVNEISENTSKSLFAPVVINVPKIVTTENPTAEAKPKEKKPTENAAPQSETKPDEIVDERKSAEQGEIRPRVVVTENVTENAAEQVPPCKIITGQEIISILNGGGNLSVLVRFEDESDAREIKATSSSPADVEVIAEPLTVGISERGRFFIVKSISQKTGTFAVTFESACGKKEISVKVR